MKLSDLMKEMERIAPAELAEAWDNVGLLYGDPEAPVTAVVVTLDVTKAAIDYAKEIGAELIISHHPLLFSPVKAVRAPSTLYTLCQSGIAVFAAHTNLDAAKGGVNDALAAAIGLAEVETAFDGIGRVGVLPRTMTPQEFADTVSNVLSTAVQLREGTAAVRTVALVGGAGGDYVGDTVADAFLTGELKHHEWLDLPNTLTVVAAGHFATENVVVAPLAARLRAAFPMLRVEVFEGSAPFVTV